jgi:hypothetical protein
MDWTMAKAKEDFGRGLLVGVSLDRAPLGGWSVRLTSSLPRDGTGWLVDARSKTARVFKTADAALSAVEEIGLAIPSWKGQR